MSTLRRLLLLATCLPLTAWPAPPYKPVAQYTVKVIEQKAQARDNFVQGLEILDGYLYVSTGNYGKSRLLRYHFADGRVDAGRALDERIFAEGLTILGDSIYQLTWQNKAMLVYRKADLEYLRALPLAGEGWGLTNNGTALIYSDGSAQLHFVSPDSGRILRTITVTEQGRPVELLNELEWIDGAIWANIWQSERIVMIDPASGYVTGSIDLRGLLPPAEYRPGTDVLNGIARNPADGAIWVTGKRWPWLYRIELQPLEKRQETRQSGSESR
jgi:glutamine cyclotransferase